MLPLWLALQELCLSRENTMSCCVDKIAQRAHTHTHTRSKLFLTFTRTLASTIFVIWHMNDAVVSDQRAH